MIEIIAISLLFAFFAVVFSGICYNFGGKTILLLLLYLIMIAAGSVAYVVLMPDPGNEFLLIPIIGAVGALGIVISCGLAEPTGDSI